MPIINRKYAFDKHKGKGITSALLNLNPFSIAGKIGWWGTKKGAKMMYGATKWGAKKAAQATANVAKSAYDKTKEIINDRKIDKTKYHKEPTQGSVKKNGVKYTNSTNDIMMEDPLRKDKPYVNNNVLEKGKHLTSKIKNINFEDALKKLPKANLNNSLEDIARIKKSSLPEEQKNKTINQILSAFTALSNEKSVTDKSANSLKRLYDSGVTFNNPTSTDNYLNNKLENTIYTDEFHDAQGRKRRRYKRV